MMEPAAKITPAFVLPEQYADQPGLAGPYRELLRRILDDAIAIYTGRIRVGPRDFRRDAAWIEGGREEQPFSFPWVCGALGYDAQAVRAAIRPRRIMQPRAIRSAFVPRVFAAIREHLAGRPFRSRDVLILMPELEYRRVYPVLYGLTRNGRLEIVNRGSRSGGHVYRLVDSRLTRAGNPS